MGFSLRKCFHQIKFPPAASEGIRMKPHPRFSSQTQIDPRESFRDDISIGSSRRSHPPRIDRYRKQTESRQEAARKQTGSRQETSRRQPGSRQESGRKQPGSRQEAARKLDTPANWSHFCMFKCLTQGFRGNVLRFHTKRMERPSI